MKLIEIYYADDDPEDCEFFFDAVKRIEEDHTYQIDLHLYEDGDSLLKVIREQKPKNVIVFLDINMRGKSGLEVLCEIRKNSVNKEIPIVMYSTSSDINTISASKLLGADLYAVKPRYFKEIIDIIYKVIGINWDEFKSTNGNFILGQGH